MYSIVAVDTIKDKKNGLESDGMKRYTLGQSDISVSELTLGCMSLGTDSNKAERVIDSAIDAGINHLDTADLYDFGKNEEIVGKAIRNKREQLVITTKVGNHFDRDTKEWFWDPSPEHIERSVKESLSRLQTDYIDMYLLHGGTIDDPIDETVEAFERLKKEGLIRAYGISSIRPNVIREYVERSSIDAVMTQYSILDRRPEEEILGLLQEQQISVLARGPLAKGMISDHAKTQIERKGTDGFMDYTYKELCELQEQLKGLASGDITMNRMAFGYILRHPAVATAVFGASSTEQVLENTKGNRNLSHEVYLKIQEISKANFYESHR